MPLAQKVFIVKYFYKLGEDLDSIWEAFQSEYKILLHPEEAAELFSQIINAFETSGSVVSDFYYRKAALKDTTKDEIMYSSVQDVIEETVIEADDRPVIIIEEEEEEEEMIEHDEEEDEEGQVMVVEESEVLIETKMDPRALIMGESTEDTVSSEESSESEPDQSETDTDVSFKPTPRKVIIRPIKHHGQLDQENTPQAKNLPTSKRDRKPRRRSPQKFCDICNKYIRSCFAEHMATHSSTKDFVCKTCNKSFTTVRYLKEHVQTHQEGKFVCEICGKASKTKSNHNSHSKIHTGEKKYHCTLCPLKFLRPQGLKRHMLTHTGEKPYKCRHCNQEFALFMTHQMHERLHTGERPYQCHHCEKSFIGAPALNVSIHFRAIQSQAH